MAPRWPHVARIRLLGPKTCAFDCGPRRPEDHKEFPTHCVRAILVGLPRQGLLEEPFQGQQNRKFLTHRVRAILGGLKSPAKANRTGNS